MGAAGMLLGGGLLGLGATALMSKKPSYSMSTDTHSGLAATRPAVPDAPNPVETGDDGGTTQNQGMEEERERERQAALLRRQQAQEVFTSGLGAAGQASTAKKSLLGG